MKVLVHPDIADRSYVHYLRFKERARALVHRKVKQWNTHAGFPFAAIRIKRHRSRWGSCSNNRILNFNYKLLFLPELLVDYVVVHELCHLAELNHSPQFWSLVRRLCPDYRACRQLLRRYQ